MARAGERRDERGAADRQDRTGRGGGERLGRLERLRRPEDAGGGLDRGEEAGVGFDEGVHPIDFLEETTRQATRAPCWPNVTEPQTNSPATRSSGRLTGWGKRTTSPTARRMMWAEVMPGRREPGGDLDRDLLHRLGDGLAGLRPGGGLAAAIDGRVDRLRRDRRHRQGQAGLALDVADPHGEAGDGQQVRGRGGLDELRVALQRGQPRRQVDQAGQGVAQLGQDPVDQAADELGLDLGERALGLGAAGAAEEMVDADQRQLDRPLQDARAGNGSGANIAMVVGEGSPLTYSSYVRCSTRTGSTLTRTRKAELSRVLHCRAKVS